MSGAPSSGDWRSETDLRTWQTLYGRAEQAARVFFAEHFGDVCAQCFRAAELRRDPAFQCCRRTNFFPEILANPLLEGLAQESLGHSLMVLSGPHDSRGCAALGPEGCRIPLGRPEVCNAYVCDALYQCAGAALPAEMVYRIQDALEVFQEIQNAPRRSNDEYRRCDLGVSALEELLIEASRLLREHARALADCKAEVVFDLFPPGSYPTTS